MNCPQKAKGDSFQSKDEIARRQHLEPRELDQEVGMFVAIDVDFDNRLVQGLVCRVDLELAQLALGACERRALLRQEAEGLVARQAGFGIDGLELDVPGWPRPSS